MHERPLKVQKIATNLEVGFIKKGLNYEVKSLVFSNNEIQTSLSLCHWKSVINKWFVGTRAIRVEKLRLINENIDSMNMTEIGHNPKDF